MSTRWRWLVTTVVAAALLVAGSLLLRVLPDDEDRVAEPHVVQAAIGDTVDLRESRVRIERVSGSTEVDDGEVQVSPGRWVLVEYVVEATDANTHPALVETTDAAGRMWNQTGRGQVSCTAGPPDVPVSCSALFEVPADAVPTLRLRLASTSDPRFDVLAEIDLGLTADDAAAYAAAEPLVVPDPTVGDPQ
ncbi:MAG: hypothetical protein ACXWDL_04355 [Nocardioides sp.]